MNINSSTFHSSIIIKTPYSLFFIKEVYFCVKRKVYVLSRPVVSRVVPGLPEICASLTWQGRVRDARGHQVPTLGPLTSWIRGKHEKMGVCLSVLVSLLPAPQANNIGFKLNIFTWTQERNVWKSQDQRQDFNDKKVIPLGIAKDYQIFYYTTFIKRIV